MYVVRKYISVFLGCITLYGGGFGESYRGRQNKTKSGLTCQKWTSTTPHTPTVIANDNNGIGDHNYCRNPNRRDTVWCYTTSETVEWEYCSVPYCGL